MTSGLNERELRGLVAAAVAAPSIHNSQPWRFVLRRDGIEVYADPWRLLDIVDPAGRELHISCGAAVLNLRVALRVQGRLAPTELLPSPDDPLHVATVSVGPPAPPGAHDRVLHAAVWRRHTQRGPFENRSPEGATLQRLSETAAQEGAVLRVLDVADRESVVALVRTAETRLRNDPSYRRELRHWTTDAEGGQGVPTWAFGPASLIDELPVRDFAAGRPVAGRRTVTFEAGSAIAVLSTAGDTPADWVRAGQALERVLLEATAAGLVASMFTQPLELPELRELLTGTGDLQWPQMILRIGYGPEAQSAPRRPLDDVIRVPTELVEL